MSITVDSKAFRVIMQKLNKIEAVINERSDTKWISEAEAMNLTGLGTRQLARKRKEGVFNWGTATGRKIKYLRRDVMAYLNNNSTLINQN